MELEDPRRYDELSRRIRAKPALRQLYSEVYGRYEECVSRCPARGSVVEIGCGAGFASERIPGLITTDLIPYPSASIVCDAMSLPVADETLRAILMFNVFHHIPDARRFFGEVQRCLVPGGRLFMVDQYLGLLSTPIYTKLHHEPCDPGASEWRTLGSGALGGANGAMANIVFQRDRAIFEKEFPALAVRRFEPHTPLRYWLSGGLKPWTLLPGWAFGLATAVDGWLSRAATSFCSFVDIELEKTGTK